MAVLEATLLDALGRPRSLDIAKKGIRTSRDFANMMTALMSDLIEGKVSPGVGNATCNAGGKLLKVIEMQEKFGKTGSGAEKLLHLAGDPLQIEAKPEEQTQNVKPAA